MELMAAFARLCRLGRPGASRRRSCGKRTGREPPLADQAAGLCPEPARGDEEAPRGCGWFDSSWSLRQGLQVTEHETVHDLSADVPLGWWLAWQSGPERSSLAAAARSARRAR